MQFLTQTLYRYKNDKIHACICMCTCFEILQSPALQGTITVSPQIHIEPLLGYLQSVSNLHVLRQLHRCLRFIFTVAPFQIRTSTDKATATTRTATLLSQIHIQIRKLTNKNSYNNNNNKDTVVSDYFSRWLHFILGTTKTQKA